MARFASRRNVDFLVNEVFRAESLLNHDYYSNHSSETFNLIIDTAWNMAEDIMYPAFREMDEAPPRYEEGIVRVHPVVRTFLRQCGEGGWVNPAMPFEMGGQQVPSLVVFAVYYIWTAANYPLSVFLSLSTGAANLIANFGSPELKELYLDHLFKGEWQGTMALTEPDAGSSLADISTQAVETGQGYYLIKGKKIFISAGDTDAVDNTVHLMLARIKGAPAGVKGISLFVVPKYRPDQNGKLEFNDIVCNGTEHKMGYMGCPASQLAMGDNNDCRGYIVGQPNRGLAYMFQMMNEERLNVGIGAAGKATAAYYASLEYARQRLQGRKLTEKDTAGPQISIVEHPDVRRMLLFQKAISEGSAALSLQIASYLDLVKAGKDPERNALLADLLVPVAKSYPAEMGILTTSAAVQCLGGYGYCRDFPVEQYYRDIRIDTLHEGTTGIQAQDLLGRKVLMHKGRAYRFFLEEAGKAIKQARDYEELRPYAAEMEKALDQLNRVTGYLTGLAAQGKTEESLADASIYLEMFGIVAVAWQWLQQALAVCLALNGPEVAEPDRDFYSGKLLTFKYFFIYELPKIEGLVKILQNPESITVEMNADWLDR